MKKYSLDVWLSGSKECFGLFDSEEVALEEGRILECSLGHPVKYAANPVHIVDEVEDMNPKDINGSFTAYYADSMDQSCPGEIHAKVSRLTIQKQNVNTKKRRKISVSITFQHSINKAATWGGAITVIMCTR